MLISMVLRAMFTFPREGLPDLSIQDDLTHHLEPGVISTQRADVVLCAVPRTGLGHCVRLGKRTGHGFLAVHALDALLRREDGDLRVLWRLRSDADDVGPLGLDHLAATRVHRRHAPLLAKLLAAWRPQR